MSNCPGAPVADNQHLKIEHGLHFGHQQSYDQVPSKATKPEDSIHLSLQGDQGSGLNSNLQLEDTFEAGCLAPFPIINTLRTDQL